MPCGFPLISSVNRLASANLGAYLLSIGVVEGTTLETPNTK